MTRMSNDDSSKNTNRNLVETESIASNNSNNENQFFDDNRVLVLNAKENIIVTRTSFFMETRHYDSTAMQLSYQMIIKKFKQTTRHHQLFIIRMIPVIIHMMIRISTFTILMINFP